MHLLDLPARLDMVGPERSLGNRDHLAGSNDLVKSALAIPEFALKPEGIDVPVIDHNDLVE
jgi:hypothetical protein